MGQGDVRRVLADQRARVLTGIAALERDHTAIVEAVALTGADDEHDPEGATLAFERARVAGALTGARARLAELDAALGRLAAGNYGVCAQCHRPMSPARLRARPTATTCVDCLPRRP